MSDFWNQSSTAMRIILVAALASVVCGLAVLCVLGLGLLGVFELPGAATPTPEMASVTVGRVVGVVVVVPTPAPEAPTATVTCRVNIRSGPGTEYEQLGVLEEGRVAEVIGVSQDGQWFVIKVAEVSTNQGWVTAECVAVSNAENVPVIPPPPVPTPTATPPATFSGWKGEYFANRDLQGEPVLVRDDPEIKFDWGTGSPAPEVPVDNFSARWTISGNLPAGTYRFSIWMDDGARMWIDDVLIIDDWKEGSHRNVSADVNLAAGTHNARVEYFEATGAAFISLDIGSVQPPPDGPPDAVISGPTQAQVGQPVTFSARNSSVATGSHLTTFEWTFGDGTVATGVDVSHIYTNPGDFQVTLKVTDDKNRSDTATQALKIVPAPLTPTTPVEGPVALISAPSQGVVGQPVTFDASQSRPSDRITSYRWAFGDGSTADAVVVQKTYNSAGVYNVTMTVTDDQGAQDDDIVQINIVAAPDATAAPTEAPTVAPTEAPTVAPTEAPTVAPTEEPTGPSANVSGPSQAQVGEEVTFDGSGSQAGGSAIVSYDWVFGDGGSDSGATVSHTYSLTGTFTVELTVTDENDLSDSASQTIEVTQP